MRKTRKTWPVVVAGASLTLILWTLAICIARGQQQTDPAKLVPILKQQREMAFDGVASCAAAVVDQNARIADLEKQLADAKAAPFANIVVLVTMPLRCASAMPRFTPSAQARSSAFTIKFLTLAFATAALL